jgi:hypothetical protein
LEWYDTISRSTPFNDNIWNPEYPGLSHFNCKSHVPEEVFDDSLQTIVACLITNSINNFSSSF